MDKRKLFEMLAAIILCVIPLKLVVIVTKGMLPQFILLISAVLGFVYLATLSLVKRIVSMSNTKKRVLSTASFGLLALNVSLLLGCAMVAVPYDFILLNFVVASGAASLAIYKAGATLPAQRKVVKNILLGAYIVGLMVLSFTILTIPGQKYDILTTSDSGWFYAIAKEIDRRGTFLDNYALSHAPHGWPVGVNGQGQPAIAVGVYRWVKAINPSVTLLDVTKLWGPVMFILSIIPVFLIGRNLCESHRNISGTAAVLFFATLTSSIYWHKIGAFDREPMQTFLSAWFIYFTIKLFRKPTIKNIVKFGALSGITLGVFIFVWDIGALYLLPMVFGGIILISINGLAEKVLMRKKWDIKPLVKICVGVVCTIAVSSMFVAAIGGSQNVWGELGKILMSYVGLGGVSDERPVVVFASEEAAPQSIMDVFGRFYTNDALLMITGFLVVIALIKFTISRKRHELFLWSCFVVLMLMVWPGKGQIRFERLFWSVWPALAGAGVVAMLTGYKFLKREAPSMVFSDKTEKRFSHPIVLGLCLLLTTTIFASNAYASALETTPPTEWRGTGIDNALIESFTWLRNNTAKNSVVVIEWSFGHLCTAISERATIADGVAEPPRQLHDVNAIAPPPDYVYYTRGTYIVPLTGLDPNYRPMNINGRRPDSDRMIVTGSENELKYLIKAYKEYGAEINYIVFIKDAMYGYNIFNATMTMTSNMVKSTNVQTDENSVIASFDGAVGVIDMQTYTAKLVQDNSLKSVEGVFIFYPDAGEFIGPIINPTSELKKIIILNILNDGTMHAVLGDFAGAPMLFRVFSRPELLPNYMSVVYTSQNGLVKIVEVDHSILFSA